MFRRDLISLGRWGHRDFLRGRSKRGGAIHTRHTHGSCGRYKRLSTLFDLRDGRRHASNHLRGGLGLKLGGGLFGLRIPRQHALSTMSRPAYELAVHGHPNITNPYRHCAASHPSLRRVMRNAALSVDVVVLLPRAPRRPQSAEAAVPALWAALLRRLAAVMAREAAALGPSSRLTLHGATCTASARCHVFGAASARGAPFSLPMDAAAALYRDHTRGAALRPASAPTGKRRVAFLGAGMRPAPTVEGAVAADTGVSPRGAQQLLSALRQSSPNALGVCLRLSEDMSLCAAPRAAPTVLKEGMDPDERGVWALPLVQMGEMMRWQYNTCDPRAHNADELPHSKRMQPVHLFIDASRVREGDDDAKPKGTKLPRSLMPWGFSEWMGKMNFRPLVHKSFEETFTALRAWSVDHQWQAMKEMHEKKSGRQISQDQ